MSSTSTNSNNSTYKYEMVQGPLTLYHGTHPTFEQFEPGRSLHVGTYKQAMARQLGKMVEVELFSHGVKMVRRKDKGQPDNERNNRRLARKGIEGIVYLNRFEGISLEKVLMLTIRKGYTAKQLREMSDTDFRKLVPEAEDSYLLFCPKLVRVKNISSVTNT